MALQDLVKGIHAELLLLHGEIRVLAQKVYWAYGVAAGLGAVAGLTVSLIVH